MSKRNKTVKAAVRRIQPQMQAEAASTVTEKEFYKRGPSMAKKDDYSIDAQAGKFESKDATSAVDGNPSGGLSEGTDAPIAASERPHTDGDYIASGRLLDADGKPINTDETRLVDAKVANPHAMQAPAVPALKAEPEKSSLGQKLLAEIKRVTDHVLPHHEKNARLVSASLAAEAVDKAKLAMREGNENGMQDSLGALQAHKVR